jgi:hypothetical protein
MAEPYYNYFIRSRWRGGAEAPSDIGLKLLKTLDALSGVDPIFANWTVHDLRNLTALSLEEARSCISSVIENNVERNDFDKPTPAYGYSVSAAAGPFNDPRSVNLRLWAGGSLCRENGPVLEFGGDDVAPDPSIVNYLLFKAALLAVNAIWRAPWVCAQAFRSGYDEVATDLGGMPATRIESVAQVPTDPAFPDSIFHIPWIGYLSAELAAGLRLAPEILTERTADGGLLMSVTTERFDPTNREHLRGARILAEALIAATGEVS